jgi:hypothetical protein
MKNLIMVTLFTTITMVSFSQERTYVVTRKANDAMETKKPYNSIIFVKDNTIEFKENGITKVYTITKKQTVNDNLTLCLVKYNDEVSEFLISENPKVIEHTKTYTRLHDTQPKKSTTFYYFSGNMNAQYNRVKPPTQFEKEGSFGAMAGATTMIGEAGSFINFSGGGWIEYKNFGIEYNMSASVTDDITAENYVNGQVGEWIAGGSSKSFGVFYKQNNGLYYGGGVQTSWILGLENVKMGQDIYSNGRLISKSYIVPKDINEKKTLPYLTIGYMKNLGDWFTFRGGVIISKFTSVNVGVGYSF